jgi:putative acetyltransferase
MLTIHLEIREGHLDHPAVIELLEEHLASMEPTAPPESQHALDLDGLRGPDITFWSLWDGSRLAGVGALKRLSGDHVEVKSMKTAPAYLRKGIASKILAHMIQYAKARGYSRISLETGSMEFFAAARHLYARFGFEPCAPFSSYVEDPYRVFMSRLLTD